MACLGNYKLGRTLGEGTFGAVKLAEHVSTGKRYAAKIVSGEEHRSMLQQEILCHRRLNHKHIVRLHEVIEAPSSCDVVLVLELVEGCDLHEHLSRQGPLPECDARRVFQQIVAAVSHCHAQSVAHRDLKLENVMIDEKFCVKLMDFGFATVTAPDQLLTDACGSPHYAAPELVRNVAYQGEAADVWSLGVILYTLVCGELPFKGDNLPVLFTNIRMGRYQAPRHVSAELADLLKQMLTVSPTRRISATEIHSHPWFPPCPFADLDAESESTDSSPRAVSDVALSTNSCAATHSKHEDRSNYVFRQGVFKEICKHPQFRQQKRTNRVFRQGLFTETCRHPWFVGGINASCGRVTENSESLSQQREAAFAMKLDPRKPVRLCEHHYATEADFTHTLHAPSMVAAY